VREFPLAWIAVLLSATLIGCATTPFMQQQAAQQEDLLTAAGFTMMLADTPGKRAQLQTLPSYEVRMRLRNQQPVYFYADPQYCQCLYLGNESHYQAYRRLAIERNVAQEPMTAALLNEDAGMNWDQWGTTW